MTIFRLLLALFLCAAATGLASAQTEKELTDLKALFEKDPAAGFARSEALFRAPLQAADLPTMLTILQVVATWAEWTRTPVAYERLAGPAAETARNRGQWQALAQIYLDRALVLICMRPLTRYESAFECRHRVVFFLEQALVFYERAGVNPPDIRGWASGRPWVLWGLKDWEAPTRSLASLLEWAKTAKGTPLGFAAAMEDVPAPRRSALQAAAEAKRVGHDEQAVTSVLQVVRAFLDDGEIHNQPTWQTLAYVVSRCLPLATGQRLSSVVPALEERLDPAKPSSAVCEVELHTALASSWTGQHDEIFVALRRAVNRLWRVDAEGYTVAMYGEFALADVLWKFGFPAEATSVVQACCRMVAQLPPSAQEDWRLRCALLFSPALPDDLRETLLAEEMLAAQRAANSVWPVVVAVKVYEDSARPADAWSAIRVGYWLAEGAEGFLSATARDDLLRRAGQLFGRGGRADLAAKAGEYAVQLATGNPQAFLRAALGASRIAADLGDWARVEPLLTPTVTAVAQQPPTETLASALLLLVEARRHLGQSADNEALLGRATEVLQRASISPVMRLYSWLDVASLTSLADRRSMALDAAQTAANEAGLGPLQEKVSQQVASLALSTGDLATAERTLLGTIERLESKREQLAFDRLVRMQWLADNLGPYRQLLTVAAKRGNGALALWVGEKMRGRALADQLAWHKVDLGVRLPRELQQRLGALRTARTKTYALLQRALGGEQLTATDLRGAYIPIRGSYLPIRGPLRGDQALTEADLAGLRQQLDDLAKEEEAIASAIREQIPAYSAVATPTPSAADLVKALAAQKDLAVLQYTRCDEGLVVVGLHGAQRPQVALIRVKGEDLWQQIGEFRQLLWERKPEANDAAVKLYNLLVAPVAGVLGGAQRLWVVGDGALQLIPFAALIGNDRQYLLAHYAVATTPSLTLALSSRGSRPKGSGAVILAAPDTGALALDGTDDKRGSYLPIRGMYLPVRGAYMPIRGEGVSTALTAMASVPLPGAKAEGEALSKLLPGATLLTDKQATKTRLEAAAEKCDLLHIATHGYADPEAPEFSALLTAGEGNESYGTLTALEVYTWHLPARLVTLSACQTALGQTVAGEGIIGLARAFLYAGAQDVLCTLWPVADESTKALMTAFYAHLAPGQPLEEALRRAQITLANNPQTQHPYFWAGFTPVKGPE